MGTKPRTPWRPGLTNKGVGVYDLSAGEETVEESAAEKSEDGE